MRFDEALREMRLGKKIRRSKDPEGFYYRIFEGRIDDSDGVSESIGFTAEEVLADDWELVPEKKKHTCWIGLFDDGDSISCDSQARIYEYARLTTENMKPLKAASLVEVRKIEWEAEG